MRRDGREAEGARLESVYTGSRIVGSNPTPSATHKGDPWVPFMSGVRGYVNGPKFDKTPKRRFGRRALRGTHRGENMP